MNNAIHVQQTIIFIVLAAGIGIALLVSCLMVTRRAREDRRIRRAVRRQGAEVLSALEIPDGLGGHMFIDYLVLTADAIRVIVIKRYEGLIYAGEKLVEWTQVVRRSSYRFPNPLRELELKIIALRAIVSDAPISGCVLFSESCEFPTRKPEGVMRLGDPVSAFDDKRPVSEQLQNAWQKLRQMQSAGR